MENWFRSILSYNLSYCMVVLPISFVLDSVANGSKQCVGSFSVGIYQKYQANVEVGNIMVWLCDCSHVIHGHVQASGKLWVWDMSSAHHCSQESPQSVWLDIGCSKKVRWGEALQSSTLFTIMRKNFFQGGASLLLHVRSTNPSYHVNRCFANLFTNVLWVNVAGGSICDLG